MERNWNPVIIGTTEFVKKNFKNYQTNIPGETSAIEIETIGLKRMVRILKRSLSWNI